ncbi:MAG: cobalamin B12-binding domain-containing protein [Myxococcales bacterium]|nr:cobalamin B12-binding domain-containing protein [Myxococcales bacterium]
MSRLLLLSAPLARRALPGGVCPSLSTLTLGSWLRSRGADVEVFDPSVALDAEALDSPRQVLDALVAHIEARDPEVVGISCLSTHEGRFGVALAARLRELSDRPVVLGGVWASALAEPVLRRCPAVSAVVCGAGEPGALALARDGLAWPAGVPGLAWRAPDGSVVHNPWARVPPSDAPLDLGLLARLAAYDIFPWLASRGCPFHCGFCTERLCSPDFMAHSAARVEGDLAAIGALAPETYLWICDPLFGVPASRNAWLCERLASVPQRFLAESRVDVLRPEDVARMAAAGCDMIYFGLEAITQASLVRLGKIGPGPGRFRRYLDGTFALVAACLEHDVLPVIGVLHPVPGDGPDDLALALERLGALAALGHGCEGVAPCFHAFPLRLDAGSPFAGEAAALAALGAAFTPADAGPFDDAFLSAASPTVGPAAATAFRAQVRALNVDDPQVMTRLRRSFPRPYVQFEHPGDTP